MHSRKLFSVYDFPNFTYVIYRQNLRFFSLIFELSRMKKKKFVFHALRYRQFRRICDWYNEERTAKAPVMTVRTAVNAAKLKCRALSSPVFTCRKSRVALTRQDEQPTAPLWRRPKYYWSSARRRNLGRVPISETSSPSPDINQQKVLIEIHILEIGSDCDIGNKNTIWINIHVLTLREIHI